MFDPVPKLILGLVTGIIFGFLLQKGRVAKYNVIMSQFLLKEWTVVKIMASAVATGAVGVYAMQTAGLVELSIKPAAFAALIVGGVLFGVGISIFGLCPGTSVAACGEGRRDAMVGVLGMLFGAGVYVAFFPALEKMGKALGDLGKVTIPQLTHTSPWLWVGLIVAAVIVVFSIAEHRKHTHHEKTAYA